MNHEQKDAVLSAIGNLEDDVNRGQMQLARDPSGKQAEELKLWIARKKAKINQLREGIY